MLSLLTASWSAEAIHLLAASLVAGNGVVVTGPQLPQGLLDEGKLGNVVRFSEHFNLSGDGVVMVSDCGSDKFVRDLLLDRREDLVPVITSASSASAYMVEKVISNNTTAAGGNASLMATAS